MLVWKGLLLMEFSPCESMPTLSSYFIFLFVVTLILAVHGQWLILDRLSNTCLRKLYEIVLSSTPFTVALFFMSSSASAGPLTPIVPFDFEPQANPNFIAGIDFDSGANATQDQFLNVTGANLKSYDLTTNGVDFDLTTINSGNFNANRDRGDPRPGGPVASAL